VLAYTYLMSAFIGLAWSRLHRRESGGDVPAAPEEQTRVSNE
jgi:hypothetical protein